MLEPNIIDSFRTRLRGPLLLPGEPGYDEGRAIWNAMIDRRPALIVRCLGVADVISAVNFAREHGLSLSVKGGGHNIAGLAVCDDGVMLDMSLMRGVWVDPNAGSARAQLGCLLGDVDRETQIHGLAAVLGFVSMTGIAGLTLAAVSVILRADLAGAPTTSCRWMWSPRTGAWCGRAKKRTAIFSGDFVAAAAILAS